MTWTYVSDFTLARDQVRFLIRDVDINNQLVQDEEIAWAVAQETNVYLAAAQVAEILGSGGGAIIREHVGDIDLHYEPGYYRLLAASLRQRAYRCAIPLAGGLTISGKQSVATDTDRTRPDFTKDLHEYPPGASSGNIDLYRP